MAGLSPLHLPDRRPPVRSYKVTPHSGGAGDKLTVSRAGVAFATVRLAKNGNATTFRVHGGGLLVGRLVNELAIARTVISAIKESLGSASAG